MKHQIHASACLILAISIIALPARASTQEYIGEVAEGEGARAKVKSVEIYYISSKPPLGNYEDFDPQEKVIYMIDGWFATRDAFLEAVVPGTRLYLRNNRNSPMFYGLYSTPRLETIGSIVKVDPITRAITVRHQRDYTMNLSDERTFTLPDDGVLRLEGKDADAETALKAGYHARCYGARPQTILAISPDAHIDGLTERRQVYAQQIERHGDLWVNEGYFHGIRHNWLMLASEDLSNPKRAGKWIDFRQQAPVTDRGRPNSIIDGHYVPAAASLRRGCRVLLVPDTAHSHTDSNTNFVQPRDDGAVEGKVIEIDADVLVIDIVSNPTGEADGFVRERRRIAIKEDAVFHLNGVKGVPREQALQPGHTVRVLPAWSGAILVRDPKVGYQKQVVPYKVEGPVRGKVTKPMTADGKGRFHLSLGHVVNVTVSPFKYVDITFDYDDGDVNNVTLHNRFNREKAWSASDIESELKFDGERLTGWIAADIGDGVVAHAGQAGRYRFELDAKSRGNFIVGAAKTLIDGNPFENATSRFAGQITTAPSTNGDSIGIMTLTNANQGRQDLILRTVVRDGKLADVFGTFPHGAHGLTIKVDADNLQYIDGRLHGHLQMHIPSAAYYGCYNKDPVVRYEIDAKRSDSTIDGEFSGQYSNDQHVGLRLMD